jgi:AcrR family transcriptional regulator
MARRVSTRPMLDPEIRAGFRRRAIADAMAELYAERGYRATTIADVSVRAKAARATIYEHFDNREQIFLTLLDRAISELLAAAEAGCRSTGGEPLQRIEAALAAILAWVAEHPAPAWACLVEAQRATPESFRRYHEALSELTALLRAAVPADHTRPETVEETLVGGVASILSRLLRGGETGRAPELLPDLSALLLAPYLKQTAITSAFAVPPELLEILPLTPSPVPLRNGAA